MASFQTVGLSKRSHWGRKKKMMPLAAPSSVTARTNIMTMTIYGKIARKYATLPELLTPRTIMRNTTAQATSRHRTKCQLGRPKQFVNVSNFKLMFVYLRFTYSVGNIVDLVLDFIPSRIRYIMYDQFPIIKPKLVLDYLQKV